MLTIGPDLAALAVIGLLCTLSVTIWCMTAGMSEDEGQAAVMSSCITALVMLVGYAITARVLDMIVLYM